MDSAGSNDNIDDSESDSKTPIASPLNDLNSESDSTFANPNSRAFGLGFVLLNCWLIFHLFSIIVCPASAEPSSPLLQAAFSFVSPYLHALYLDHGFHYFAPEPGGSTLVEYTLDMPDGTQVTGRLPNRTIFPRLFYHRHFMLTEFLGNGPEELQPLVERALARNLCRTTGATRVKLVSLLHTPVEIDSFRRGKRLDDASTFAETPLGVFDSEELRSQLTQTSVLRNGSKIQAFDPEYDDLLPIEDMP